MEVNPVARWFEPAARAAAIVCGWGLIAIAAMTAVEIFGRKLFGFSLQGVDELSGYTLAVSSTLSFSLALIARGHTRVDFLVNRLPEFVRALLNAAAMISLAALAVFAARRGLHVLEETLEFGSRATSPLQTPLWIPHSLWLAGLVLFAVIASALAMHAAWLLFRDIRKVNLFYGPPSLDEEIDREVSALKERQIGDGRR